MFCDGGVPPEGFAIRILWATMRGKEPAFIALRGKIADL